MANKPEEKSPTIPMNASPISIICFLLILLQSVSAAQKSLTCNSEIEGVNKTMHSWSALMRQMLSESASPSWNGIKGGAPREEIKFQELVKRFSASVNRKPIEQLVKDLVVIRRLSNRIALETYLRTHDNRWPQNSVQLGVAVERVQQACLSNLDRAAMMVLNSPFKSSSSSIYDKRTPLSGRSGVSDYVQ